MPQSIYYVSSILNLLFNFCFPDGYFTHLAWVALVSWLFALRGVTP